MNDHTHEVTVTEPIAEFAPIDTTPPLAELRKVDLDRVVRNIPTDLRKLVRDSKGKLFVAGGFIRAIVAGEEPSDVDVFGDSLDTLNLVCGALQSGRPGAVTHTTKNAFTLLTPGRMVLQFITRWKYPDATQLVREFDFTVCQAVVWHDGNDWKSLCSADFYADLAAKRLVYTAPIRDEEAGGSMLRVIKYVKRGYNIQALSLAGVIARLTDKLRLDGNFDRTKVILGLIREVDPVIVRDTADDDEQVQFA